MKNQIIDEILECDKKSTEAKLQHGVFVDDATKRAYQEYSDPQFMQEYLDWRRTGLNYSTEEELIEQLQAEQKVFDDWKLENGL